jgi:ATP-binding cassette subfamily B protein
VFPVLIGLNVIYQRRVDMHFQVAQHALGAFSASAHESFDGVQLVKAYGAEDRETHRLSSLAGDVRDARIRAIRLRGTFESLLEVIPSLVNVTLVLLGATRVRDGALTVGELSSFIFMFTLLVFPLRLIGYALSELPRSMSGWRRIREILDEPIEDDPALAIGVAPPGVGIELEHVAYAFPDEDDHAIVDVSLVVPAGRILAVVGPTGSGKTTLVELVGGLVPAGSGTVRLAPGRRSIVFQEAFLFAGSVRDNLCIGESFSDDELWEALRLASADRFIRELAHGLDTIVGERGVSLSGGQRQRLALARALVRRPVLLLLDDTTSALDPATEARVLSNMRHALADTTVFMVASRPSTIALADDVAYVADGRLAAYGSHVDLMTTVPGYRNLVEAFETDRDETVAVETGAVRS